MYRKKERSTDNQATGKMEQINSMKTETIMQCLPSARANTKTKTRKNTLTLFPNEKYQPKHGGSNLTKALEMRKQTERQQQTSRIYTVYTALRVKLDFKQTVSFQLPVGVVRRLDVLGRDDVEGEDAIRSTVVHFSLVPDAAWQRK